MHAGQVPTTGVKHLETEFVTGLLLLFPNALVAPVINKMQTQFDSVLEVQLNS